MIYLRSVLFKGHAHEFEQAAGLFVGLSGGDEDDIHSSDLVDLIVLDLREDDLLFESQRVIAAAVESVGRNTVEVTDTRKRDVDEFIGESVHTYVSQRDLAANVHACTDFEVSDRLLCLGDYGLLTGDLHQVAACRLDGFRILSRFTETHIDDDLLKLRDLHRALILELLHHCGGNFVYILFFKS